MSTRHDVTASRGTVALPWWNVIHFFGFSGRISVSVHNEIHYSVSALHEGLEILRFLLTEPLFTHILIL